MTKRISGKKKIQTKKILAVGRLQVVGGMWQLAGGSWQVACGPTVWGL